MCQSIYNFQGPGYVSLGMGVGWGLIVYHRKEVGIFILILICHNLGASVKHNNSLAVECRPICG